MQKHARQVIFNDDYSTIAGTPGTHQHTYTATWNCNQNEPDAKIYNDGPLILDILLLFSLWSNRHVCTGDRVEYEQHHYFNDNYFSTDRNLIDAIKSALNSLKDKHDVKKKKIYPATFMIKDSNLIRIWQYKVLYLSPAIDLVSSSFNLKKEEIYDEEEINQIEVLKGQICQLIDDRKVTDSVRQNAINPFKSAINSMGSPTAVDRLNRWLLWALDINDEKDKDSIYDNCKAFNYFRNSVVHYAGLPNRKIKIRFSKIQPVEIPKNINESICTTVGIYYFFVYREILQIWMAKVLGVDKLPGARFDVGEVMEFLQTGTWRGEFILKDAVE